MELDLAPDPGMLRSYIDASGGTLERATEEIFDNGLDQDATIIKLVANGDILVIEDNGRGIAEWAAL